jgi:hypothetical protein
MTPPRVFLCGKSIVRISRREILFYFFNFPLGGKKPRGKKMEFSKIFLKNPNRLKFCIREFFDMENSNLKEFFNFDHWKLPLIVSKKVS